MVRFWVVNEHDVSICATKQRYIRNYKTLKRN